ncbi:MAG: hypothetical protein J2P34_04560, partial [Actinobacteria bacterium]|nr:hypothetical protein [Actinomycetota bacterium]
RPGRPGAGRPLPKGGPLYTPGAGSTRRTVEARSARMLLLLHQYPRWLVPTVLAALLVAGLAVPGAGGAAALAALAAVLAWLAYVSWPAIGSQGRLLRVISIAAAVAIAVIQARR